ncbi:uncharacterized protein HMPREF1541_02067 [Cyphellophora europaea CBS 101466]|uniref:CAP-Gly domain-containing protein n=1 Tax=Cyphellophora europaea (strain CBS 101466) TaxID=1220924 RepID=W2S4P4_CYPE1|nr:uncharacterized protein HMPREF1541_02067 [Cyphellophora europaea CBS 101466]ETN42909.1 hypothetical protein HMPREF1541_02067 [Cyphellophora europaea CBS 101466]
MAQSNLKIGDAVTVPGDMFGTVKFIGRVANKKGTFAGVQLATEFAPRGKNSGDVEGKQYFTTTIPGSGIFLPVEKAVKRPPIPNANGGSALRTPGTPTRLSSFNVGGRTPGTTSKPNFSQSVNAAGNFNAMRAGAASPGLKPPMRRESLPRPQSPLRKSASPVKTGLATPKSRPGAPGLARSQVGGPGGYRSAGPKPSLGGGNKFSQSLRAASMASTLTTQSEDSLGPEPSFDEVPEEEAEDTPTPTPSGAAKQPGEAQPDRLHQEEKAHLQKMLDEKDRALREQNNSIAEMERNLTELQKLVPGLSDGFSPAPRSRMQQDIEDEDLPRDVAALRGALREKNEKIKLLTAEFDNNRADFRSTIDTLEMASTETERVYEKRVDELLEEVRHLQDRSEDVDSVAQQLRQLEELVQELEEGLEDARRGEAEARGEVEFLRGEVERSRSELRRERERKRTEEQLNGYGNSESGPNYDQERLDEMNSQLDSKDDEIRGLKAIIRTLQTTEAAIPKANGVKTALPRNESGDLRDGDGNHLSMQQQIHDLEALLQQKTAHQEELENEVTKLRNSVQFGKFPMTGHTAFGLRSGGNGYNSRPNSGYADNKDKDKHVSTGTQGSQKTVVLSPKIGEHGSGNQWHDADEETGSPSRGGRGGEDQDALGHKRQVSDTEVHSEASESSATAWCEICEESGHDILSCKNMMGSGGAVQDDRSHMRNKQSESMPAPLMSRKSTKDSVQTVTGNGASNGDGRGNGALVHTSAPSSPPDSELPPPPPPARNDSDDSKRELKMPIEGTGAQAGMWAGKSTGVIDPDKWCALCERDGHESVDCPIEDAF